MHRQLLFVSTLIFSFILLIGFLIPGGDRIKNSFHTPEEIAAFQNRTMNTISPGQYFLHSEHCRGCHGFDSAHVANIDENGNSVNLFDHWQSTMMANSARDPLWRAKVSHEILVDPAHAAALQDKCTSCHAPMGKYTSLFHGTAHYGLAELANDSLGKDGVACESCHTIGTSVGHTFSGSIPYDTSGNVYGPFTLPDVGPMQLYEGYTPVYSDHMNQARICSSCHTLITQTVDTFGNYTGGIFTEQATYHEYINSRYPADTITCQTCHMPRLTDAIVIANGFASLQARFPFNQHTFAGANSFMLNLIKTNKASLGADAEDWKFDSTITATNILLRERSILFNLQLDSAANDTGYFHVRIENKAGHKFPSGYPSRRAVVQFLLTDAIGDTVFKSGTFTPDYRVAGENPSFEPHHDIISQSDVPQIYEMVMGDVNGHFTSVLERAAFPLKDNRIPPIGFTTASPVYDTVLISNDALADDNFNRVNSIEGSGVDFIHYHVPLAQATGYVTVHASVFYQSVPPKWTDEMFTFNSAEIDSFRTMFNNADQTPVLIASDSIVNMVLSARQNLTLENEIAIYPTVSTDGNVFIKTPTGQGIKHIDVYDLKGSKIYEKSFEGTTNLCCVSLPARQSVYIMKILSAGKIHCQKIIRQ